MSVNTNDYANQLLARIAELELIEVAARKLVRCKGRYHSEINYRALAAMFGVTVPDITPKASVDFNAYMDEFIPNPAFGERMEKRRLVWSEPKKRIAEDVWNDCLQRNGVTENAASD